MRSLRRATPGRTWPVCTRQPAADSGAGLLVNAASPCSPCGASPTDLERASVVVRTPNDE